MRVASAPPLHLTYCLNIHPGESWADCAQALQEHTLAVRAAVAPGRPFGVGLRLGARAARELARRHHLLALRDMLARHDLYAFTINGFPYGPFHGRPVKEQVYQPDWRDPARAAYTCLLADLLADVLPRGVSGSISTVPVGFGADFARREERRAASRHLLACARHLAALETMTGHEIHLGLEPEPACVLETADDALAFFAELQEEAGPAEAELVRRHLGICLDTCHAALAFEDPAETWDRYVAAGLRISKVQISAALACDGGEPARVALQPFVEPVYLHQVRGRDRAGAVRRWTDLPEALADPAWSAQQQVRVHFHVPVCWAGRAPLRSTADTLSAGFWARLRSGACSHLEIETYTYDVMPAELRQATVAASIQREFAWVLDRLGPGHPIG